MVGSTLCKWNGKVNKKVGRCEVDVDDERRSWEAQQGRDAFALVASSRDALSHGHISHGRSNGPSEGNQQYGWFRRRSSVCGIQLSYSQNLYMYRSKCPTLLAPQAEYTCLLYTLKLCMYFDYLKTANMHRGVCVIFHQQSK